MANWHVNKNRKEILHIVLCVHICLIKKRECENEKNGEREKRAALLLRTSRSQHARYSRDSALARRSAASCVSQIHCSI